MVIQMRVTNEIVQLTEHGYTMLSAKNTISAAKLTQSLQNLAKKKLRRRLGKSVWNFQKIQSKKEKTDRKMH